MDEASTAALDRALSSGEREFRELADFAPVLIWRSSPDKLCDWFNKPWLDFVGRTMEQEVGFGWAENVHPEDYERCVAIYVDAFDARRTFSMEYRMRHHSGQYRWVLDNGAPFQRSGEFAGYFGTCTDIQTIVEARETLMRSRQELEGQVARELADRLKAEDAMRQSQKMEAIGQLTGGVAHDFNNLLTVIRGSVDLLRREGLPEEKRARYIQAIGDTADRAAKLTGQLLAFARRQVLKPELFDVGASLGEVAELIPTLTGSGVTLNVQVPTEACFVMADRSQFDTALVNIAINARDAMEGQGTLTIETGPVSGIPAIGQHPPVNGDFIAVTIADTGKGMSSEVLGRIFEPFYTTKAVGEGTGLGLSQATGFAHQSGGSIKADSVLGQGSTFTLYLPRAYPEADTLAAHTGTAEARCGEGICVLVVEDNEQVGEFATQALRELGYNTILAPDAKHALDELRIASDRFQLVFSDVVMPGMNGLDLGNEIRRLYPKVPVILTSGYSHVLAQNSAHGFELLHKPYSIEGLSRVLHKALI